MVVEADWDQFEDFRNWIDYEGGATFVRRCQKCCRFVKADKEILVNEWSGLSKEPNATCKKCGRTRMLFAGFC